MDTSRTPNRTAFPFFWFQELWLDRRRQAASDVLAADLQASLDREKMLLHENRELLRRHSAQAEEFDHRLLNSIQMIASLLSNQSRLTASPEAAAELTVAVNRVVAFGHVHRQLHLLDDRKTVEFTQYVQRLCKDLSSLLFRDPISHAIVVEGDACELPTALGIPLGFIVNELVTNSAKYAKGHIIVRIGTSATDTHSLSISDDGPGLPDGFRVEDSKGLGMKIVTALVQQIGGELRVTAGQNGRGACFAVEFRSPDAGGRH
jgi:two-component sensor histidine kinase